MSRLLTYCCAILVVIVTLLHSAEALSDSTRRTILSVHNQFRNIHHAPNLVYSTVLENYAQGVSNTCRMVHSGGPYGENLAEGYPTVQAAITAWYNEVKSYDYSKPGFSGSTGHFTQVVWKGTTQVGCGITTCDNFYKGAQMVACSYYKPGNIVSSDNLYFVNNVLKP